MRFYSFTNMYTSGIHAGIQTAHAVHEMQRKYALRTSSDEMGLDKLKAYNEWADKHQTIIVLNAGYHASLDALYEELKEPSAWLQLPVVRWRESKEALNGATTAIGLVVPKEVYKLYGPNDARVWPTPNTPQDQIFKILGRYPLAS